MPGTKKGCPKADLLGALGGAPRKKNTRICPSRTRTMISVVIKLFSCWVWVALRASYFAFVGFKNDPRLPEEAAEILRHRMGCWGMSG